MLVTKTLPQSKSTTKSNVCPTCGGLECFERPRYFCGQLLTDKDLDGAQRYVIEKNKLHNRYLVGSGVVCGLIVSCDPKNKGIVLVEPGYAIDCCGNDIILCKIVPFDVLRYLEACRREQTADCNSKNGDLASRPKDVQKDYDLVLSYNEEHTRPITALIRDKSCTVNSCEPSRTREVFRFDLIERLGLQHQLLSLLRRACDCFDILVPEKPPMEILNKLQNVINTPNPGYAVVHNLFSILKKHTQNLFGACSPGGRCNVCDELQEIQFPPKGENDRLEDYPRIWNAFGTLIGYTAQYVLDCICHEVLIACHKCTSDDKVVLASLTMKDDILIRICNLCRRWQPAPIHRQQAEVQALQPVFSLIKDGWLPTWDMSGTIDEVLERLCCEENVTTIFLEPKPDNLEGFRKVMHDATTNLQGVYAQAREICGQVLLHEREIKLEVRRRKK
ncbi:MAG: hypothetical protein ACREOO_04790 [bacterium]